jgi:sporulation protein YlmC with PRC-barrel domain
MKTEISDYVAYVESLSAEARAELAELLGGSIEDAKGVQIVKDDDVCVAPKEETVEKVAVKKVKCKCCGFAKKHYRVNAEGICKVCYVTLATSDGETVVVVGRQGKKGHNAVSIVVGGERVKVSRKVRLDS